MNMKTNFSRTSLIVSMLMTMFGSAYAEETEASAAKWTGTVGSDLVSHYVWRGQDMAGVSLQPTLGVEWNGLSLSAWGSYSFDKDDTKEFDLTLSYTIGGLTVGVTDYWFSYSDPAIKNRYFQYQAHETAHVWEGNVGYDFGCLALNWYTNFGGADGVNEDGDRAFSSYFNVTCPFEWVGLNWEAELGIVPWETSFYAETDKANVSNVGIGAVKTINCSNGFSFGLSSKAIWNPTTNYGFFVLGVSL